MKKMLTLLLVVVMLVTCMATTVSAAKAGDEVTIEFVSSGNPGFGSYNAQISYDAAALKLVAIKEGSLTASTGIFRGNVDTAKVGYAGVANITGDGVLFTATFKVLDAAKLNEVYNITAAVIEGSASNIANENVTFQIVGGTISVECEHKNWSDWTQTKTPDCVNPGEETRTCNDCGAKETRAIDAEGHILKWEYNDDQHWQVCSKCDYVSAKENHAFDENGKCICGAKRLDDQPDTGDGISPVVTFSAISMIGMLAAAAYVTKRMIVK